jgi:dTDP-4-dehydrorhamnose 3,5-epimerase
MNFLPTAIPDVKLIEPQVFGDARGFFVETFQAKRFAAAGLPTDFVQDNHSGSRQHTLRGLHYQITQPQGKLVSAVVGEIFDVAVDLRRSSPTCGQWAGATLTAANHRQIWVPPGFAHGFYVLSEWAEIIYKTTDFYAPAAERTLLWSDPTVNIPWPLRVAVPLLSDKDAAGRPWADCELYD